MIFAAVDYFQYRLRFGRYGDQQWSLWDIAFRYEIPNETIEQLQPGDILLTQRLNSNFSWASMFVTSSSLDHSAVYVGDGQVLHMTLQGSRLHSLNAVVKGTRSLIFRMSPKAVTAWTTPETENRFLAEFFASTPRLPARLLFALAGLQVVAGYYVERFRWKFYVDIGLVAVLCDIATYSLFQFAGAWFFALVFTLFSVWNVERMGQLGRMAGGEIIMSHPDEILRAFGRYGGYVYTKLGPMVVAPGLGVLPLAVYLKLARTSGQSTDDGPQDEL